jgi:hypothetical protein
MAASKLALATRPRFQAVGRRTKLKRLVKRNVTIKPKPCLIGANQIKEVFNWWRMIS